MKIVTRFLFNRLLDWFIENLFELIQSQKNFLKRSYLIFFG